MSATSEMLRRHRQALSRLIKLQFDLHEALHNEASLPESSPDPERIWAELLCLLPALNACLRSLNAALGDNHSFTDCLDELDRHGSELCRLHLLASRCTGAGSSEAKAATKGAVEALLAGLVEWTSAAAQTEKVDKSVQVSAAYPPRPTPPGHDVNEAGGEGGYVRRNDRREDHGSFCCAPG